MNSKVVCFLLLAVMAHIALGGEGSGENEDGKLKFFIMKKMAHKVMGQLKEPCKEHHDALHDHIHGKFKDCFEKEEGEEDDRKKIWNCLKEKIKDIKFEDFPVMKGECRNKVIEMFKIEGCNES